ncbi:MAG TPA: TolC family protein, partial [Fimbriimonas sp.]|nr:TolC family protein [Fimbriimonas sp.]
MPVLRTPWLVAALLATASAWSQQEPLPVKPPDVPTGVVPLPQGPPNTAPQSSLPAPAQLSTRSLAWSPDLSAVKGFVSKQPVTLQQAVAIALYTNRNFSAAIANLQQAEGRTGEARAELNPSITFNGNVPYYDKATTFDTSALSGGGIGNSSAPPFVVLPQFNPVFTAALTLPIDLFGATRSAASQAQLNEVAARIDINRVRNQVVYDVKSAFFNVLRAQAQVAVATDNVNNALARLDDANKNYQAGTNSRFDIITAQRDVADAQQSLIVAKAQVSVNLAALKNTMGLDIASHLDISSQGAVQQPEGVQPPSAVQTAGKSPEEPQPAAPVDKTNASPKEPGGKIVPLTPPSLQNVSDDFDFGLEYRHLLDEALHNRPEILEAEAQVSAQHKGL